MPELSERDRELLETMVSVPAGVQAFEIAAGDDTLVDPRWPTAVRRPTRGEIRSLVTRDYLEIDKSVAPSWRFWPAAAARQQFAGDDARRRADALKDPDARLGVILDAIVEAFENEPGSPLLILRTDQVASSGIRVGRSSPTSRACTTFGSSISSI